MSPLQNGGICINYGMNLRRQNYEIKIRKCKMGIWKPGAERNRDPLQSSSFQKVKVNQFLGGHNTFFFVYILKV